MQGKECAVGLGDAVQRPIGIISGNGEQFWTMIMCHIGYQSSLFCGGLVMSRCRRARVTGSNSVG